MTQVTLQEAQSHRSELIEKLAPGEGVTITKDDRPVSRTRPLLRSELLKRFREDISLPDSPSSGHTNRRTVGQLIAARDKLAEEWTRNEEERKAAEQVRRERERAEARVKHLDNLARREPEGWREVEALIARAQSKS